MDATRSVEPNETKAIVARNLKKVKGVNEMNVSAKNTRFGLRMTVETLEYGYTTVQHWVYKTETND